MTERIGDKRKNCTKFDVVYLGRSNNCKISYFGSLIGRECLQNIRKWKPHVQSLQKLLFFVVKFANFQRFCRCRPQDNFSSQLQKLWSLWMNSWALLSWLPKCQIVLSHEYWTIKPIESCTSFQGSTRERETNRNIKLRIVFSPSFCQLSHLWTGIHISFFWQSTAS